MSMIWAFLHWMEILNIKPLFQRRWWFFITKIKEKIMLVKVLKKFKDKNTGKIHEVGAEVEYTQKRVKEILSVDAFVEEIPKEDEK